ncbi:MAG TPA: O-antigen ligase family protein [Gemmatimonadaceae bacterium]|nr:O-antigen ligase family protein [Gemmatimonadaceae bacterium]
MHFGFARDPLRITLFLLLVVTISRVHQALGLNALRPAFLLFAFAAGYAFITPNSLVRESPFRYWPTRVVAALLVMACLSAPFGISLGGSASFILSDYAKVLVVAFLLMMVIRGTSDLSMFVTAYVVSAGVLVWMAVFIFRLQMTSEGMARLDNMYTYDANDLGCVLITGLPLVVLALQTSKRRGKVVCGVILAGIGLAIARSGSRGAFVGLATVGLAILIMLKEVPAPKRVGFVAAVLLALIIAAPKGYWDQMLTIVHPKQDYNWTERDGRKQIWERGMHYMWTHPLFGIGINNFGRAEGTISSLAKSYELGDAGIRWAAPHNSFVQAGAEMGVPGLILWSSLVFGGMVACMRIRRRLPSTWLHGDREQRFLYLMSVYLSISFLGFAVTAFFVSFAYLDPIYILAAYLVGYYRSVDLKLREMRIPSGPPPVQWSRVTGQRGGLAVAHGRAPRPTRVLGA